MHEEARAADGNLGRGSGQDSNAGRVVALTGGIGSGKSTAATMFREMKIQVFDADAIAREVVAPGTPALQAVVERFGSDMVQADGSLHRAQLAQRVFSDAEARDQLNAIVHPAVRARLQAMLHALPPDARHPYVVYDIPLLYETGQQQDFDVVVVVDAPQPLREERLRARGMRDEDIRARMAAQMPLEEKAKRADHVLWNGGSRAALQASCARLHARLSSSSDSSTGQPPKIHEKARP